MTDEEFNDILNQAQNLTDAQLKDNITNLINISDKDLKDIAPTADDKTKLLQLMQIVRRAADSNDKKALLLANIESYASIILSIAGKFLV